MQKLCEVLIDVIEVQDKLFFYPFWQRILHSPCAASVTCRNIPDWQKRQAEEIVMKEDEITSQKKNLLLIRNDKQVLLGFSRSEHQKLQVEQTNKKSRKVQQLI